MHRHTFIKKLPDATQHTVIDKIRHMNVFVCGRLSYELLLPSTMQVEVMIVIVLCHSVIL